MTTTPKYENVTVEGIGRVGNLGKARRGGYSRSRKHWSLCIPNRETRVLESGCTVTGGYIELEEYGKFKTKKAATGKMVELHESGEIVINKGYAHIYLKDVALTRPL